MHVPETISRNTIAVYAPGRATRKERLDAEDLVEWRKSLPRRLNEICLDAIAANWEDRPILEELILEQDARYLLDTLSTDLPLELVVAKIDDDIYWRRCYDARWPEKPPLNRPPKNLAGVVIRRPSTDFSLDSRPTWKRCFLEMHLQEALENLKPEDYNAQQIKVLVDLCKGHIGRLQLDQLVAHPTRNRIPLHSIVAGLPHLVELSICFKQTYAGENFDWYVLQTSEQDIRRLAMGLEKCNLQVLRIINSDVNGDKAKILVKSLISGRRLRTLDFSHCSIGDAGVVALAALLRNVDTLEELILTNNRIGVEGLRTLIYVLSTEPNNLKRLDVNLNDFGTIGGNYLAHLLASNQCNLESLKAAGCGLTEGNLSLLDALRQNTKLKILDLSSSRLGEKFGTAILDLLQVNTILTKVDLRMSGIPHDIVFSIQEQLETLRKTSPSTFQNVTPFDRVEVQFDEEQILEELRDVLSGIDLAASEFDDEEEVEDEEENEEICEDEEKVDEG